MLENGIRVVCGRAERTEENRATRVMILAISVVALQVCLTGCRAKMIEALLDVGYRTICRARLLACRVRSPRLEAQCTTYTALEQEKRRTGATRRGHRLVHRDQLTKTGQCTTSEKKAAVSMSAKKAKKSSEPAPTLDNPLFISWLMVNNKIMLDPLHLHSIHLRTSVAQGDADRVAMLRTGLEGLKSPTTRIIGVLPLPVHCCK